VPDHIWAVDARSGHTLWHYDHATTQGLHIGHRGVAMYKGWLYFVTPDAHLISLNATHLLGYWKSHASAERTNQARR
jgi:alcohol dehydrogenase (cytochrome c)